jgi:hypothetical protein
MAAPWGQSVRSTRIKARRNPRGQSTRRPDRNAPRRDESADVGRHHTWAATVHWRDTKRGKQLDDLVKRTTGIKWSPKLLTLLLEELYVEEEFAELLGNPRTLPLGKYPQAFAVALALRHSWRQDDLERTTSQLIPKR